MNIDALEQLKQWFYRSKRDLPWRKKKTPYRVWISEIMLQQTQVAAVIPYFEQFIKKFPDVYALAEADLSEVIKVWEGLGYYSRARNMHEAAKQIIDRFKGEIPKDPLQLKTLKGFGSYTANAVAAFAFHQKVAPVDGNVLRVIARYYSIGSDICKSRTKQEISERVESFLPDNEPEIIAEALIELGALICTKNPHCLICPLRLSCQANREGKATFYPCKAKKKAITKIYRLVAVCIHNGQVLVAKGNQGKVMADLWEFPYFSLSHKSSSFDWDSLPFSILSRRPLPEQNHTFTRYHATLYPHLIHIQERCPFKGYIWIPIEQLSNLPFSAGHRKIQKNLLYQNL